VEMVSGQDDRAAAAGGGGGAACGWRSGWRLDDGRGGGAGQRKDEGDVSGAALLARVGGFSGEQRPESRGGEETTPGKGEDRVELL
jgi:hypothetical protein